MKFKDQEDKDLFLYKIEKEITQYEENIESMAIKLLELKDDLDIFNKKLAELKDILYRANLADLE